MKICKIMFSINIERLNSFKSLLVVIFDIDIDIYVIIFIYVI